MKTLVAIFFWGLLLGSGYMTSAAEKPDSLYISVLNARAYKVYLYNPDSSVSLAVESLSLSLDGNHPYLEGECYFILSKAYWVKTNYKLSTEYAFKALKIFDNSTHVKLWVQSLLSLARTFVDIRNVDKAREYLNRAVALATMHSDRQLLAHAFREYSLLYAVQNQNDSSLFFIDKALNLYDVLKDSLNTAVLYGRKAQIFYAQRNYHESQRLTYAGLRIDTLVRNNRGSGISYGMAALNCYAMQNYDSAIFFLKKSIVLNKRVGNFIWLIKTHSLMADIYSLQNKPALAVDQLRLSSMYKDSVYNAQKNGQIEEMLSLYDVETKNKTIHELSQEKLVQENQMRNQRMALALLILGIFLLVALTLVLTRLRNTQVKANKFLSQKNTAIEEQKKLIESQAQNLQDVNALKSKLFSVISHDLRGPIATLHGLLDLVSSKHLSEDEFNVLCTKIKTNLSVTQRTLENLLNWSLSQMDGLRTEKTQFRIQPVIEECCKLMEEIASKKNVSIQRDYPDSVEVLADANQVHLILRNLIHNSIKFSRQNGTVLITLHTNHERCKIVIKDFGIGMTAEEMSKLNGANKHFTKNGTQEEKGTGLGLLLCHEFIKQNGGELHIKSAPEEGTEVSFTLLQAPVTAGSLLHQNV